MLEHHISSGCIFNFNLVTTLCSHARLGLGKQHDFDLKHLVWSPHARLPTFVTINTDENCQVTHENLKHWFGSSTTVTSASPYESQVTIIANNVSVI